MTTARAWIRQRSTFQLVILASVIVGAIIRVLYIRSYDGLVLGDGFAYSGEAHRLADGLGYTSSLGDVGAQSAHHPPGWVTVLAGVTWLGGRAMRTHQYVGAVIGLGIIVMAGLAGRRFVNERTGAIAAGIAAIYPGFWVIEAQILSEPLGLLLLGGYLLMVARLADDISVRNAVLTGIVGGILVLTRSDYLVLMIIAAAIILLARDRELARRIGLVAATAVACVVVLTPWSLYNSTRFEAQVLMSTNLGTTMLAGNCTPEAFAGGDLAGLYDISCNRAQPRGNEDRSLRDRWATDQALDNIGDNASKLPLTVLLRYGRTLGVYRPSQTVSIVAGWMGTGTWPVWTWIISYLALVPWIIAGAWILRHRPRSLAVLLSPIVVSIAIVTVFYGEPRYHTPGDLTALILAAAAMDAALRALQRRRHREVDQWESQSQSMPYTNG